MLLYLLSRIISALVAFLYPGYASFKCLSKRPASEEELERWLTYWSVLGCIVFVEYVAEWLVSWVPFYYPIKTLFLLYLVLPQTQGSMVIYRLHVAPFFALHEPRIDAALGELKTYILNFLQSRLRLVWDSLSSSANAVPPAANAPQQPTMSDPVSGPTMMLGGLWRTYGPAIVAGGTALLSQQRTNTNAGMRTPPGGPSRVASGVQGASAGQEGYDVGGRGYEEVEVPSDAEDEQPRSRAGGGGWFWGGGAQAQGYERVKSD